MIRFDESSGKWAVGDGAPRYSTREEALAELSNSMERNGPGQPGRRKPRKPATSERKPKSLIKRRRPLQAELASKVKRCRSCGAAIIWTLSAKNTKRLPVNAQPVPQGNLELTIDHQGDLISSVVENKLELHLYLAHFATCPQGNNWRSRKPKAKGGEA